MQQITANVAKGIGQLNRSGVEKCFFEYHDINRGTKVNTTLTGANPTIASYNDSAVKPYNIINSLEYYLKKFVL
jgi:hypothetical protein